MTRTLLLSLLALCALAAPAHAVVGGTPLEPSAVPWYADVGVCGGTLIAPDRVATAAHCVLGHPVDELGASVNGTFRAAKRFAVHPGWERPNGDNVRDDVAVVELAAPVPGVPAVTIGGTADGGTIVGRGLDIAPGTTRGEHFGGKLASAPLRTLTDAECASTFGKRRGNGGERFAAAGMLCAIDVDGRAPLSSGCNGDSGGPFTTGPGTAPVLLGIVSWGGAKCGADHLPSVFADAGHYRRFLTRPSPVWAPAPAGTLEVTGRKAVGGVLRCTVPGWTVKPTRVDVTWQRQGGRHVVTAGRKASYRVRSADAGHVLVCAISARTAGGFTSMKFTPAAQAKIPR
jgi:hypothetical protein